MQQSIIFLYLPPGFGCCSDIICAQSFDNNHGPLKLTFNTESQSLTLCSIEGYGVPVIPALFINTSILPNFFLASCTNSIYYKSLVHNIYKYTQLLLNNYLDNFQVCLHLMKYIQQLNFYLFLIFHSLNLLNYLYVLHQEIFLLHGMLKLQQNVYLNQKKLCNFILKMLVFFFKL